jgi:Spy/CpxP family protein refolding chaperone
MEEQAAAVLTAEQMEELAEMREERKGRMKGRHGFGGRGRY